MVNRGPTEYRLMKACILLMEHQGSRRSGLQLFVFSREVARTRENLRRARSDGDHGDNAEKKTFLFR